MGKDIRKEKAPMGWRDVDALRHGPLHDHGGGVDGSGRDVLSDKLEGIILRSTSKLLFMHNGAVEGLVL